MHEFGWQSLEVALEGHSSGQTHTHVWREWAVSDPQCRGPAPINYSITPMALVITARAHSFDQRMRFNSLHYSSQGLHRIVRIHSAFSQTLFFFLYHIKNVFILIVLDA